MSNDRKEPTLSNNPNISLGEKRARSGGTALNSQRVVVKKQSSGLLWLTFLLTLIAMGAIGYTFWQLHGAQQLLVQQQVRINELENKLALSDDESTQSLTALTANAKSLNKDLKLVLSEVDKLWAARNANRKGIAESKEQLSKKSEQLQQSLIATEKKLSKPVASLKQRSSEQELLIQSLRERLSGQEKRLDTLSAQPKEYASKKDLQALLDKSNKLSSKVRDHDEAIDAFDKFRVTVNRDLLLMKQRAKNTSSTAKPL